jgi:hypothetical protein
VLAGAVGVAAGASGTDARSVLALLLLPGRDDGERGDFGAGLGGADGVAGGRGRLIVRREKLFEAVLDG